MHILERSITRPYWEPRYRLIVRQYQDGWGQKVKNTRVTQIRGTGAGSVIYYTKFMNTANGPRPVGWLMLWKKAGWFCWEVSQLWVFPAYRGQGIAGELYKAAINADGLMLSSGKLHTKHSRRLWENFIRKKTFNIWAHDIKQLDVTSDVLWEDGSILTALTLYTEKVDRKSDVRLMALAKDWHGKSRSKLY